MTMSTVHYIAMETSLSCLFINKEETAPSHRMQNWLKSHREALSASLLINAHMNLCSYDICTNGSKTSWLGMQSFVWSNKPSIIWSVCHSVQIEAIRPRWFWSFGGCLSTPLMWKCHSGEFPRESWVSKRDAIALKKEMWMIFGQNSRSRAGELTRQAALWHGWHFRQPPPPIPTPYPPPCPLLYTPPPPLCPVFVYAPLFVTTLNTHLLNCP